MSAFSPHVHMREDARATSSSITVKDRRQAAAAAGGLLRRRHLVGNAEQSAGRVFQNYFSRF